MPERPSIPDEGVLERWMKLELGRLNEGVVVDRKTLAELTKEERPVAVTKGGKEYRFERGALAHLAGRLDADIAERLRLPIIFYLDAEVKDSCALQDRVALEALVRLGELSPLRTFRGGRVWVARALAYSLTVRYPTLVQLAMR